MALAMPLVMHKDDVVISTPCGADWNAMEPRGRARLCRSCDKLVHDLSGMQQGEAGELLARTPTSLCVRYLYDQTGKIWFREDFAQSTSGVIPSQRLTRGAKGALALSALVAAPLLVQACGGNAGNDGYYRNPNPANEGDAGVVPSDDQTAIDQSAVEIAVPETPDEPLPR